MKRYRLTALLLALCFVLTACAGEEGSAGASSSSGDVSQEEERRPRTAPFTLAVYPEFSLHPALAVNRANLTLAPLLYESLFLSLIHISEPTRPY